MTRWLPFVMVFGPFVFALVFSPRDIAPAAVWTVMLGMAFFGPLGAPSRPNDSVMGDGWAPSLPADAEPSEPWEGYE